MDDRSWKRIIITTKQYLLQLFGFMVGQGNTLHILHIVLFVIAHTWLRIWTLVFTFREVCCCFKCVFGISLGGGKLSHKPTIRIFLSCYWIFLVTIMATYTGNLIAFMTVKKPKVPVNTLEELATNPEYQAGVLKGSSHHTLFEVDIFRRPCLVKTTKKALS